MSHEHMGLLEARLRPSFKSSTKTSRISNRNQSTRKEPNPRFFLRVRVLKSEVAKRTSRRRRSGWVSEHGVSGLGILGPRGWLELQGFGTLGYVALRLVIREL